MDTRSLFICQRAIPLEAEHRFRAQHPSTGGDERNRTADPLLAKQVLSRLSYIPDPIADFGFRISNSEIINPQLPGGPSWDRTRDLTLIKRAL